ncbi:STE3-domain-containing protein [Coniophora puteana RWD-64-598 SS2]|uniref:STE3-domain-containing protein n=1 Tax=Coniophora puteana (strain RWD-64-598) TaxID=741705 RepID=A0A5M3MCF8_CONPW|nr:STE3-domain-containing protein [Coniophora puteana RWD-64-598 SS2]EIW76325.1 STE3-domain-containing protein [Coniophora puteana RWD-64-598 SS2]
MSIHLPAWNTGSVLYIIWTSVMCLAVAVNALVWNDNTENWAPVWCDISSRLILGGSVAIPAATLCINRRLHQILTLRYQRHRCVLNVATDTCIGLGIPALVIGTYSVIQHYRFFLVENIGCYPSVGPWLASIPLNLVWPLLVTIISVVYSVFAIRAAIRQRNKFEHNLTGNNRLPTAHRSRNLMILCLIQNVYQLVVSIINLISMVPQGTSETGSFWPGWTTVHANSSHVSSWLARPVPSTIAAQISPWTRTDWQGNPWVALSMYLFEWTYVVHALFYFALLGFTREAKTSYARMFRLFRLSQSRQSMEGSSTTIVPSDVDKQITSDTSQGRPRTRTATRTASSLASMLFLSFGSVRPAPGAAGDRSPNALEQAGDREPDDGDGISLDTLGDGSKLSGDSCEGPEALARLPAVSVGERRGGKLDRVLGRSPSAAEIT